MISFDDLIGTPYTKEHDCNWLAATVAERMGQKFPENLETPDDQDTWAEKFRTILANHYRKIKEPFDGCIAIFAVPYLNGKIGWHCGTVIKPGWMITTRESASVHICRINSPLWRVSLKGFYAYEK